MKAIRIFSLILFGTMLISSCESMTTRTILGSGDVETMEIELSDFSGVNVTGTCNVDISIGDNFSVMLHAQAQVLDVMTYRVINGILQIGFDPDYNVKTDEEISASIVLPSLNFVGVSGAGDYSLAGAKQAKLDIDITGVGNVQAFNMEVDECNISITGSGNCEVNVLQKLQATISGVGNVFFKGNPEVTSNISGVGRIIAAER